MIAFLNADGNTPELSDELTILVIMGLNDVIHFLTIHVGNGSNKHCLLGDASTIFSISSSVAGLKELSVELAKTSMLWGSAPVCFDSRCSRILSILLLKKLLNVCGRASASEVGNNDALCLWKKVLTTLKSDF